MVKRINPTTLQGRMGNLIFYLRDGSQMVRTVPQHVKNPRTPAQQRQRLKLTLTARWLSPIKDFLHLGFAAQGP